MQALVKGHCPPACWLLPLRPLPGHHLLLPPHFSLTDQPPCIPCAVQDSIFADMYSGSRSPLSPTEFLYQWWRYAEPMANYDQQDAHEFYLSLLEGLAGSRITPPGGSSSSNGEGGKAAAVPVAAGRGGSSQQLRQAGPGDSRALGAAAKPSVTAAAGGRVEGQPVAGPLSPQRHLWQHTQQPPLAAAAAAAAGWPTCPSGPPSHPQQQQAGGSHNPYVQQPALAQQQTAAAGAAAAPAAVNGLLPNGMRPAIPLQLHVAGCSHLGGGASRGLPVTGAVAAAAGGGGGGGPGAGRATTPEVLMVGTGDGGASQPSPSPEPGEHAAMSCAWEQLESEPGAKCHPVCAPA
jgi:hypothetical protein